MVLTKNVLEVSLILSLEHILPYVYIKQVSRSWKPGKVFQNGIPIREMQFTQNQRLFSFLMSSKRVTQGMSENWGIRSFSSHPGINDVLYILSNLQKWIEISGNEGAGFFLSFWNREESWVSQVVEIYSHWYVKKFETKLMYSKQTIWIWKLAIFVDERVNFVINKFCSTKCEYECEYACLLWKEKSVHNLGNSWLTKWHISDRDYIYLAFLMKLRKTPTCVDSFLAALGTVWILQYSRDSLLSRGTPYCNHPCASIVLLKTDGEGCHPCVPGGSRGRPPSLAF